MTATIEFGVLGPLLVSSGGEPVPVPLGRQHTVLALLLLRADRPVSLDCLVDAIWDDTPPATAVNQVATCISRLRHALTAAGADAGLIGTWRPGYRFDTRQARLDTRQVDLDAVQARAIAGDDPGRAAVLLRRALARWRGPVLADVQSHALRAEIQYWEERRLDIAEQLAGLALRVGDHEEAVLTLAPLSAEHPLREGLHGKLMLALYRAGRQTDALDLYQTLARRLREEVGVEPTRPLRQLHAAMLSADPSLGWPEPGSHPVDNGSPRLSVVPAQLPPDVYGFAGRREELSRLDAILATARSEPTAVIISAVSGTAGVGKTALALHWAHRAAAGFPDGQLYVNLHGFDPAAAPVRPEEAVRGFLAALGVPAQRIPTDLDAQVAHYRSLLAGRRMLIVLDNAHDAGQVRPLLPGSQGCLVLVTSRNDLAGLVSAEGAYPLILDLLTPAEARELLACRVGLMRVAAAPSAVEEIIGRCAGLPLALAIVAARAAARPAFPLAALAAELCEDRAALDAFDGPDPVTDLRATFSWSYQQLGAPAARLFRLLGLHPAADIGGPAAASLAGLPVPEARPMLAELTRAHLLAERSPGRYAFHDLLRAYAAELTRLHDAEAERRAAIRRVLDHYLHTAHAADRLLNPHRDSIVVPPPQPDVTPEPVTDRRQATAWFTGEHKVLLVAVEQAAEPGFERHAGLLAWTIGGFLETHGHWQDWAATQAVALTATYRQADRPGQARAHRSLAGAYIRLGRLDEALDHLGRAGVRYQEFGDDAGLGHCRLATCIVLARQGRIAAALVHAEQAVELYRAAGHHVGEGNALNMIGWYHTRLGHHEEALFYCRQALAVLQQVGHRVGEAMTWDSLGHAHQHLSRHVEALTCYQRALVLLREDDNRYYEADTLTHLGDAHAAAGDRRSARVAWQQALHILRELSHPDADTLRARLEPPD